VEFMSSRFHWTTFDLNSQLPPGWEQDVRVAAAAADFRDFPRTPVLSREAADVLHIWRGRVHADQVQQLLPWLYRFYRDGFLELAGEACGERVMAAGDDRYGVVLNVQRGTSMRFECHIDSNPLTGLLFSVIRPHAGHLIFFDARKHPHYARPLAAENDMRVTAVMNFYTESYPESTRPRELNEHLYGDR
jgi:hypothetical protein